MIPLTSFGLVCRLPFGPIAPKKIRQIMEDEAYNQKQKIRQIHRHEASLPRIERSRGSEISYRAPRYSKTPRAWGVFFKHAPSSHEVALFHEMFL